MLAAALAFLFTGCQQEEHFLDEVKVSSSYVAIPVEGGEVEITVTAADAWTITGIPEWFSVNGVSGNYEDDKLVLASVEGAAGESKITFKAEATDATREALVYLTCAGATQNINVLQQAEKAEIAISPIGDVLKAESGTFRIKGEVYGIYNTQYGNFYMKDETGDILIYGCLDANGAEKNFSSLGIDNGDVIVCEGPLTIYNGTYELVNVTVLSIEKSLLKVDSVSYGEVAEGEEAPTAIALEGGSAVVTLTSKTGGVNVEIPEDAKSWLSVGGVNVDGTTVAVTLNAAENKLGDRTTTVTFTTKSGDKTYTAVADIAQKGAILEVTAAEINAAADGETIYRLTGYISEDTGSEYGNIYITDYTGTVYVYGVLDAEGQSKQWLNMGIKAGDIVTVEGVKTSYKESPQMKNVQVTKHIAVTPVTVADFTGKADDKEVYYQLTGTVANIVMDKNDPTEQNVYGNFDLVDETGSIYVYGLLQGWGGPSKMFREMNIKEGDKITIVGVHASYNGAAQVGSAFLAAHEAGEGGLNPEVEPLTVAEFSAKEDGDTWYQLTGTISALENVEYGNFDLVDETGTIYVFGLTATKVDGNDKSFESLGLKDGDKLTLIGQKSSYNGRAEVANAYYVSHEAGEGGGDTPSMAVDGKQWLADLGGLKILVDLGASEEGMMLVALENSGLYDLYMAGSYTASATDATSGSIIFSQMDLSTGDFGSPMSMTYSGLTETSVDVTSVDVFEVTDPISFVKVDDYINIEMPGEGGGGDVTENSIENGDYWIVNAELQKLMIPLAENSTYGYLKSSDMIDGASYAKNAFTFTYDAVQTRYTIQDSYGRYLYASINAEGEYYNSFNVSATLPESGAYWSVEARGDGTYDIYNGDSYFSISYSPDFGSWETRDPGDVLFSGIYPTLVKADNPVAEPEPDPEPEADEVIKIADVIAAMGLTANMNLPEGTPLTLGGLTVTYTRHNSSSTSNFNVSDGGLRWYANDVLDVTSNKAIAKVEFVTYGGKIGPVTADTGTMDEEGLVWSGDASAISFTASAQIRVSEVRVTYKK